MARIRGQLEHHAHFAMQKIEKPADIYPVFRELFKKQAEMMSAASDPEKPGRTFVAAPCQRLPEQSEWTFELIEQAHARSGGSPRIRPGHLSEPAGNHHGRADDGCLYLGRDAGLL